MLAFEFFGSLLRRLKWVKILFYYDFLQELLLLGIVAVEKFGLYQADTGMLENVLLVLALDVLVVNRVAGLSINPA